jgi:hypothetical protein
MPLRSSHPAPPSVRMAWSAASKSRSALSSFAMVASPATAIVSAPASNRSAARYQQASGLDARMKRRERMLDRLLCADRTLAKDAPLSRAGKRTREAVAGIADR